MAVLNPNRLTAPLHILLIEDDEGDRALALAYLKEDSSNLYQVTWVESLEAGLAKLATTRFDAIILDLVLPDSQGVTTVSKLCAQSRGIPVIVSSYFDENALASKVIELGAQDYLAKDLMDSQTLGRTMTRALARAKHQAAQLSEKRFRSPSQAHPSRQQDQLSAKIQQLQADIRRLESVASHLNQSSEEKQQTLDDMRHQMVKTLSHECRSPATVILLATNILKSYDKKIKEEQYLATITRIDDAVKQMMHLIDSAMNFKQVQTLTELSQVRQVNLQALCQTTITRLSETFTPPPRFNIKSVGDCTNVSLYQEVAEQVLEQLLTNAVQYAPAQSPVAITLQHRHKKITIQVKDNGCGMSEAEKSQAFEAFYRANRIHSIHGIGLGLTIVKTCVDVCGGEIKLDSELDVGTTVTVVLPELS